MEPDLPVTVEQGDKIKTGGNPAGRQRQSGADRFGGYGFAQDLHSGQVGQDNVGGRYRLLQCYGKNML